MPDELKPNFRLTVASRCGAVRMGNAPLTHEQFVEVVRKVFEVPGIVVSYEEAREALRMLHANHCGYNATDEQIEAMIPDLTPASKGSV